MWLASANFCGGADRCLFFVFFVSNSLEREKRREKKGSFFVVNLNWIQLNEQTEKLVHIAL